MENEELEKTGPVTLRVLRKMIQMYDPKMFSSPNAIEVWISIGQEILKSFLFSEDSEMRWVLRRWLTDFLGDLPES